MNQNVLLTIAASVGLLAGAGGTWFATSTSSKEVEVVSKEVIAAFIRADPSLCPIPTVEAPTQAAALSAYLKAYAESPLVWDRENLPEITLALGQCDKARSGPGVACMISVKMGPQAQPLDRMVGCAKAASGAWIATLN
ncbi:hypothetical protein [Rhizobium leguminosarum]|uniref:hypothetical protein n=1 Tax=Rhizobium leguminosarum TaxID=384 RepID=UPI00143F6D75|nr:hypothetical protein [Rhizobium leguminosarum]NKL21087.1 hypothetical protein [Rhizobium leguminosarum bv. viciae]NKL56793.1 hypothetical protein [Rhizobium leguminosarum bv. viciae]